MTRYIALLRAINVGGYRKIKMEELRKMFSSMGFQNTSTYIQSGNVIFDSEERDSRDVADRIRQQIDETFGHDVPVLLRTASGLEEIADRVPFEKEEGWMRYITFLPETPSADTISKLESHSGAIERFQVSQREVYSIVDKQTDEKPNFSNSFIEKLFGMRGTTRNLRTVLKLLELARSTGRD